MQKIKQNIEIVTACIIKHEDRILVTRSPKWKGQWTVPGGHVKYQEKILDGATREGLEETGLILNPIKIIGYGEIVNPPEFLRPAHFIYFICLLGCRDKNNLKFNKEISEAKWLPLNEALKLDLTSGHRRILEQYAKEQN